VHPELIRALADERQADRFRRQKFSQHQIRASLTRAGHVRHPVARARRHLGLWLVSAGTRLLGRNAVSVHLLDAPRP
jgi:hypothetical protein